MYSIQTAACEFRRMRVLPLFAAVALLAAPAAAHRMAEAFTVIEFNPRTGAVEVVHTLNLHDLDHVFSLRLGKPVAVGDDRKSLEAVAAHIAEAFVLDRLDGTSIPLRLAGMEIDRGDLVAYYEAPRPEGLDGFVITNALLMADLPGQTNRVNVELPGGVRTLIFDDGAEARAVRFSGPGDERREERKSEPEKTGK